MNNTNYYLTSSAFVLIDCDFPFSENVVEELKRYQRLNNSRVQSIYDMIAKVNAGSEDQLHEIVTRKVGEIEGIKNTLTMIIITSKDPKESKHI